MAAELDTYNLPDTAIPVGSTISSVKVSAWCGIGEYILQPGWIANPNGYFRIAIRTHSAVYYGATHNKIVDWYVLIEDTWATNPNTGLAWTIAELNALEIGVELRSTTFTKIGIVKAIHPAFCTQVYATITYTEPVAGKGMINKFNRTTTSPRREL